MSLTNSEILVMGGGHVIIDDTSEHTNYSFSGFIPHEDTTFTSLFIKGSNVTPAGTDVTPTGIYKAGIYYGAPKHLGVYNKFQLAGGSIVLVLTVDSEDSY